MDIIVILLVLIGIAFLAAIFISVVTGILMLFVALVISIYRMFRYRAWTKEGRERLRNL